MHTMVLYCGHSYTVNFCNAVICGCNCGCDVIERPLKLLVILRATIAVADHNL